jgi:hypothetical protein
MGTVSSEDGFPTSEEVRREIHTSKGTKYFQKGIYMGFNGEGTFGET